jgi:hypothetical protein
MEPPLRMVSEMPEAGLLTLTLSLSLSLTLPAPSWPLCSGLLSRPLGILVGYRSVPDLPDMT